MTAQSRVEINAARTLASWSASFEERILHRAQELALAASQRNTVTDSELRQAIRDILPSLLELAGGDACHGGREAA